MLLPIASPICSPRLYFFNQHGKPLVGGKVYAYKADYENQFQPTYKDALRHALNQNPIHLDNAGSALIYMFAPTRLEVYDKSGRWIERRFLPKTEYYKQFYDRYGKPLSGGKIWTYDISSTIKKPSYQDAEQTIVNTNPIVLDHEGGATICMAGAYRLRLYDHRDVFVTDQDYKQENRYVVTSKVYPLYMDESVKTHLAIASAVQHDLVNSTSLPREDMTTQIAMLSATIRNLMNSYICDPEMIQPHLALTHAMQRNLVNQVHLPQENIKSSIALTKATQKVLLVTYIAKVEHIKSSFALTGAQIIN